MAELDSRVHDPAPRRRNRIAVFGGSFNPPHFAHQAIVAWLLSTEQADEVWMMPCWRHMFGKRLAPYQDRLAMCGAAASIFSRCTISAVEGMLKGRSVMLRTIQRLKEDGDITNTEFSLVIGLDNWLVRDKWEGFDQLERECRIIVVGRNDQPRLPDIRSTMVRSMLAAGEDVSNMLPRGVLSYIAKHGLYGCRKP